MKKQRRVSTNSKQLEKMYPTTFKTKDSNDIAEFSYDALGRRIEKKDLVDPNNTRRYYYNYNWQVLCEYNGSEAIQKLFIYGNYIDEVVWVFSWNPFVYAWYAHDHLYSPAAMINSQGNVLERYEYDAYGACQILEPNFAPDLDQKSDYGNPYLFTGRRWDILDSGSLKIQYSRNRYYDYYTGRWLTHDPLGITPNLQWPNEFDIIGQYEDGMGLYEYVRSNPVTYTDPFGEMSSCPGPMWWGETVGGSVGLEPTLPWGSDYITVVECEWKLIEKRIIPSNDDDGPYTDDDIDNTACPYVGEMTTNLITKDRGTETIRSCDNSMCCETIRKYRIKFKFLARYYCRYNHKWSKTYEGKASKERHLKSEEKWCIRKTHRKVPRSHYGLGA